MAVGILGAIVAAPTILAATTVIPSTSLSSYSTFETYWAYLYPWGSDHNGSTLTFERLALQVHLLNFRDITGARMKGSSSDHSNIVVGSNTLSLIATPTSNPSPPTSTANPHPAIRYAR